MPCRLSIALTVALHPSLALACGPTPPAFDGDPSGGVSISVGRIADRAWEPRLIDGQPVPPDAGLSLTIGVEGQVTGNTGCNRISGTADLDAGAIALGGLAVTERACLEPERMKREAIWLKALGEARGFIVSPEGLWLTREDGSVAACLE
jgi:heat shock protein HslJ